MALARAMVSDAATMASDAAILDLMQRLLGPGAELAARCSWEAIEARRRQASASMAHSKNEGGCEGEVRIDSLATEPLAAVETLHVGTALCHDQIEANIENALTPVEPLRLADLESGTSLGSDIRAADNQPPSPCKTSSWLRLIPFTSPWALKTSALSNSKRSSSCPPCCSVQQDCVDAEMPIRALASDFAPPAAASSTSPSQPVHEADGAVLSADTEDCVDAEMPIRALASDFAPPAAASSTSPSQPVHEAD